MFAIKRIFFFALVAGLACVNADARAATRGGASKKPYAPSQCIVVPAPGVPIDVINTQYGYTTIDQVGDAYLLRLPPGLNPAKAVRTLRDDSAVQAAGTNNVVASPSSRRARHPIQTFPNDLAEGLTHDRGGYDIQPFLDVLEINGMSGARGTGVTIAVIDTGFDLTHPDLVGHWATDASGNVIGADFLDGDADPTDVRAPGGSADVENAAFGHGTFIAGLIAKIAPDAKILPIRALGPDGVGLEFDIIRAVQFALDNGAHVISMSFGSPTKLDGLDEVLDQNRDRAVMLAAAGNNATDREALFPAEEGFVLAVSAVDNAGVKASFSNWGSLVDLAAPGNEIVSTYPDGQYATWSGTSFATPMAAATAALVASHRLDASGHLSSVTVQCVRRTLVDTGTSLDTIVANDKFRGKIGKLISPIRAFASTTCGSGASGHADLEAVDRNDRTAQGEAEYVLDTSRQEFEVKVDGLKNGQYTLRATMSGGAVVTDTFGVTRGQARVEYSSTPGADERTLPAELEPVTSLQKVEILDARGVVVLSGAFLERSSESGDDDGTGGGGDDDGGGSGGDDDGGGDGGGGSGGDDGGIDDGGGVGGGGSQELSAQTVLWPVGSDADASGSADWRVEGTRQRFRVRVDDLDPHTTYTVIVNGASVGELTTDDSGRGELDFDSDEVPLPDAVDPVTEISTVDVSGPSGPVLSGSF